MLDHSGMGVGTVDLYPISIGYPILVVLAVAGVWTASRASVYLGSKDPQIIVIDEVAGQLLTFTVGSAWPGGFESLRSAFHYPWWVPDYSESFLLSWKCLLAGFILFRVFDIWKPFPARQAESLPRGWGIMADDWIAGLYAAFGIWFLRALGL